MLGAIIGDIAGSRFEFRNHRSKDFDIFAKGCFFTDDTVMTAAIADALSSGRHINANMRRFAKDFPNRGYGGMFSMWLKNPKMGPYNSFGNGAAMRVSAAGWLAKSEEEAKKLSFRATIPTHDHPEGIKGAETVAVCIFKLRNGASKDEIRAYAQSMYPQIAKFDYETLKREYEFNETCMETVPQAIYCFLISDGFEDCLRTAISIGGDSDTLAAIACSIAEAMYGVPNELAFDMMDFFSKKAAEKLLTPILRCYQIAKYNARKYNIG